MIAILIVFAGVVIGLLLLRRMWMENVDYMNKTGLQPLPGESLKAFRERVRREFPTSSKIPVNDDDPVMAIVKLTYLVNEVVQKGVMVTISGTPDKMVFKLFGKPVLIDDLVAVRKVAERHVPEGVEIVVLPVFEKDMEAP